MLVLFVGILFIAHTKSGLCILSSIPVFICFFNTYLGTYTCSLFHLFFVLFATPYLKGTKANKQKTWKLGDNSEEESCNGRLKREYVGGDLPQSKLAIERSAQNLW